MCVYTLAISAKDAIQFGGSKWPAGSFKAKFISKVKFLQFRVWATPFILY